jgi:hypothetical protein
MGSRTRSWLLFIAAFASTSGIYWLAAVIGMNLFVGIAVPDWWLPSSSRLAQYMSWTHAMTFVGLVLVSLPIGVAIRRESRTPPGRVRVFSITGRHHRTYIDPDAASPRTHGPGQSSVNGC